MAVHGQVRAQLGDDALVDPDVHPVIDAFDRVEHAGVADDEILLACVSCEQHHATSIGTSALTGFGPLVSRS